MNVRFHPPKDQEQYTDHVLSVLLRAALPQAQAQLEQLMQNEKPADGSRSA